VGLNLLLGFRVFKGKFGARGQSFGQNDHGAAGANRVSESVYRIGLSRQVDQNRHL